MCWESPGIAPDNGTNDFGRVWSIFSWNNIGPKNKTTVYYHDIYISREKNDGIDLFIQLYEYFIIYFA